MSVRSMLRQSMMVPSPHRGLRCELCRLRYTDPDTYEWVTRQLLGLADGEPLSQAEIAAEVERRTGESTTQSQVSNHKTKHLDPTLRDAIESMTGHLVMLEHFAGTDPSDMAVGYVKLAVAKIGQMLASTDNPKLASTLAGAQAQLSGLLLKAESAEARATLDEVEARLATLREDQALADEEARFADWVRAHYPDLEPLLADPERLKALLAQMNCANEFAPRKGRDHA